MKPQFIKMGRSPVCVKGSLAGVDNVWEQKKPEAKKMIENGPNPVSGDYLSLCIDLTDG